MIRRTMAAVLFVALLFVQGAMEQCHVRCAMPMAAMAMGASACDGMDMTASGAVAHQAASCERHGCQAASLDALVEDHPAATAGQVEVSSLLPVLLWPDGMRLAEPSTGPPGVRADVTLPLDDVGRRLTDSLRV